MRALASPASLKGVLSARAAAAALAEGLRRGGADAVEVPVADGGEGTLDVLEGLLPEGVAAVESADVIGLGVVTGDVMRASSRPLGELIKEVIAAGPDELIVFLGGTGTVDGGAGLLEVLDELPVPTRAACDVRAKLLDAVWVFAAQKGATPEQLPELERRLLENVALQPYRETPGSGAAGGLGAALAALGAELVEGAPLVLELIGFGERLRDADLVITGEGSVDRSTWMGKAPEAVLRACREHGVRCAIFGGRVLEAPEDVELYELSGEPARAHEDLVELGTRLAASAERTGRTA
ncbi:MAG TPA: glycerate kinase [Gaiellaceae bacterium]|nr:glycerate kinase [Gaiellaceae bacterium]